MTKRQERLRKALENGPDAMGPDEPGWAVDAVYNVPDAGVSLRGRQAIEDMIKVLDKHLDVRVVSMEEHTPSSPCMQKSRTGCRAWSTRVRWPWW
jgi:hypothetical protein